MENNRVQTHGRQTSTNVNITHNSTAVSAGRTKANNHFKCRAIGAVMPPSYRMRGATAVLVRHKPQWHRHDRRSSAVVPSLIAVAPPKTVKTADLRGGTAETFKMFRRASAVLPPPHRRRGATAVLVRHKPQWHRHDRRGSAVIQSLIAVAPPKTVKTADLRGGTAETFNIFKTSAVSSRVGPIRRGTAMTAVAPYKDRSSTSFTAVPPP